MTDSLGDESPRYAPHVFRPTSRYLVVIEAAGSMIARLFDTAHRPVAEFDAGSEEVAVMTAGLSPLRSAGAAVWDAALHGHSASERAAADVYTLDV
jgi:hypothetical protein